MASTADEVPKRRSGTGAVDKLGPLMGQDVVLMDSTEIYAEPGSSRVIGHG